MYEFEDYLDSDNASPKGGRRTIYAGYVFKKPAKPAQYCECGQKLSIANEGDVCFSCTRKVKGDLAKFL